MRAVTGIADHFTGGIFDFDKRGDTKLQDLGQGFVDNMTLGKTDFDEKGRSPVQNVIQNVFGLVKKGLTGRDGEKGQKGAIEQYQKDRLAYYKKLKHFKTFGKGWTRRNKETTAAAKKMI